MTYDCCNYSCSSVCRDFRNSNKLNFIKGLPPLCMCVLGLISKHIRIRLASHSAIHRIPNLVVCQYLNLFYGTMHTYMYTNVCIKARLLETSRFQDIKERGNMHCPVKYYLSWVHLVTSLAC